jgi:tRNA/rRNA methyltransferase
VPLAFQPDRVEVVLVSPRNPLNIGAAARAMANFGFSRLTVVAPYEKHWREAQSAVGAEELLQNARITESLVEAVADCTLVAGTGTLTYRKPEQRVVALPALPLLAERAIGRGGRVALVLGPEKRGLTREDLSHCHLLVEIPTHPRQPSMNLGQAVAVCLYELAAHGFATGEMAANRHRAVALDPVGASEPAPVSGEPAVASGDLDRLAMVIEQVMLAAEYSPPKMQAANRHDLRLLLRRLALSRRDERRILGLFRRVLRRLQG